MQVFLLFLFAAFAVGAVGRLEPVRSRWQIILAATIVVGASFYTLRVVS
jgi:hypothetical protein